MKKLFTAILIFCTISIMAQSTIKELNGAFGLTFGMSMDSVKIILKAKGGKLFNDDATHDMLTFTELTFGGRKAIVTNALFADNMLCMIIFIFLPDFEARTQEYFNGIKDDIQNKYGDPRCVRKFSGMYRDGDGFELQAIKKGYADISCYWSFIFDNRISLEIQEDLTVKLSYINMEASKMMYDRVKKKESNDF